MALLPNPVKQTPICWCGHDLFYHYIEILDPEAKTIEVGRCQEKGCECHRFYSTVNWLHELLERMKKYVRREEI